MLMQRCPLKAEGDFHMHRLGVSPNCVHYILKVSSADWLSLESEGVSKESVSRFLSGAVSVQSTSQSGRLLMAMA